jgi:plasmid stabilization system protein ParE
MSGYIVSPKADDDIFLIWEYLFGRISLELANRVESELYAAFRRTREKPGHRPQAFRSHVSSRAFLCSLFVHDRVPAEYSA